MGYSVNVPISKPLEFPNVCPFSGAPAPSGRICLRQSTGSSGLPLPSLRHNGCSKTILHIPASRRIALLAFGTGIMSWVSLLAGMGTCVWLIASPSEAPRMMPFLCLLGGTLAAVGFRNLRHFVLRRVRVRNAENGLAELLFESETYARDFSRRNQLALNKDSD